MKEILITSSVLILALLALRGLFRKTVSRRVQYALWGLVALRLLLPVNLPAARHSVLTVTEPVRSAITERMETPHTLGPRQTPTTPAETPITPVETPMSPVTDPAPSVTPAVTEPAKAGETPAQPAAAAETPALRFTTAQALTALWLLGAAGMALWFVLSNLRFARFLRRGRIPLARPDCPLPVYLVEEGLPSPCLAGLLRPAVYLTPAVAGDARRERHVLAHELTHARHLDPLWSFLRCLCLTVYWFDPLVWIAAHASRSDCELACDEGTLRRLGEGERIPYGETLLSLIPVGRPDPMLSATTMTAGKRQLRERIRRIASGHRQAALAVFAVLCAAAILCAATFTGSAADRAFGPDGVLSGSEIQYFNETFFNQEEDPDAIRNHFLIPEYERPEDIDLYDLFYCGVPVATGETVSGWQRLSSNDPDAVCPTDILPVSAMDAVLRQYTGLSLGKTRQLGLDRFDHPEEDLYTHLHGDTNALSDIQVLTGERQGDTVTLYYTTYGSGGLWYCVTLQQQRDGSFQFRSNLPCEKPAVAPRLPETAPVLTLSLADARALEPQPMPLTHHGDDRAEEGGGLSIQSESGEEYSICAYRATDGRIYVALEHTDWVPTGDDGRTGYVTWEADSFLTVPENGDTQSPNAVGLDFFRDLLGRSGFVVSYSDNYTSTVQEYYYLAEDGTPCLLLRTSELGLAEQLDLDGDGVDELYNSQGLLYFLRDGTVYEADVKSLLQAAWPDMSFWDWSYLDSNYRHIQLSGFVHMPDWDEPDSDAADYLHEPGGSIADFYRYLYFDGESLRVYRELQAVAYTDHLAGTVTAPSDVVTAAKARVLENYSAMQEDCPGFPIDDWRVTGVSLEDTIPLTDGRSLEIYRVSGSFHATYPARRSMAGNIWLDEDGWFSGYTRRSPYLAFLADGGKRALVESDLPDDCSPGAPAFDAAVTELLLDQGCVTFADLTEETLAEYFNQYPFRCLDRLGKCPEAEWDDCLNRIRNYQAEAGRQDFVDSMYRLLHSSSSLTEDAARCYRRLLTLENSDTTRIPVSVELMCRSAMQARYDRDRSDPAYAGAELATCWTRMVTLAADYPDFHGRHLEVYRVDYRYFCRYPEKVTAEGARVLGDWVFPSPDDAAYVLFEVAEDLHRVRLGDTDIPGISPESDPAAFRKALEDYFRTEHPGEIEGLGQSLAEAPARPLALTREDAGALRAALERRQDESQQSSYMPLSNDWTFWMFQEDGVWSLYLVNGDGAYAALPLADPGIQPEDSWDGGAVLTWTQRTEDGIYRCQADFSDLTLRQTFTAK